MSAVKIFVPRDAAALSVGAQEVAEAIAGEAAKRGVAVELIRNGSRGLLWLEPLVEVVTEGGRIAYGPVTPEQVPSLFEAGFTHGKPHALQRGSVEDIPYFKQQERLTFATLRTKVIAACAQPWHSTPPPSWPRWRIPGCEAVAAPHSPPVSSGKLCWPRPRSRSTSSAMPTRETRVRSLIA